MCITQSGKEFEQGTHVTNILRSLGDSNNILLKSVDYMAMMYSDPYWIFKVLLTNMWYGMLRNWSPLTDLTQIFQQDITPL